MRILVYLILVHIYTGMRILVYLILAYIYTSMRILVSSAVGSAIDTYEETSIY